LIDGKIEVYISVEMVDKFIDCMKKGEAARIDGLAVEYLMYSHLGNVVAYVSSTNMSCFCFLQLVTMLHLSMKCRP